MPDAKTNPSKPKSWRDVLPIHPAAEMFPMMSAEELKTLGEDIRKQGQRVPIAVWKAQKHSRPELLDGRNRLDAMEAVGIGIRVDYEGTDLDPRVRLFKHMPPDGPWWPIDIAELSGLDPYDVVLSANIHRRHLTAGQRREVIAKVLKATPGKSNRQIAETVKADHKTVGAVRDKLEARGEIPHVETVEDSKGRQQPAHKPPNATPCAPDPEEEPVAEDNPAISQCVADIRERIDEAMDDIPRNEWLTLTERLHEAINDVSDQRRPARATHQPDEMPDIPKFLRRQS